MSSAGTKRSTTQRPAAKRQATARPTAKRPASRRQPGAGWWRRVAVACALLAVVGALIGVVVATSGSNRVQDRTVVLDVRTPEEFASGHLDGAVNLDADAPDFAERAAELDPGREYLVYCRTGRRAERVVEHLRGLGFTDVTNAGTLHLAAWTTHLDIVG